LAVDAGGVQAASGKAVGSADTRVVSAGPANGGSASRAHADSVERSSLPGPPLPPGRDGGCELRPGL